jgi:hypothetical protein
MPSAAIFGEHRGHRLHLAVGLARAQRRERLEGGAPVALRSALSRQRAKRAGSSWASSVAQAT